MISFHMLHHNILTQILHLCLPLHSLISGCLSTLFSSPCTTIISKSARYHSYYRHLWHIGTSKWHLFICFTTIFLPVRKYFRTSFMSPSSFSNICLSTLLSNYFYSNYSVIHFVLTYPIDILSPLHLSPNSQAKKRHSLLVLSCINWITKKAKNLLISHKQGGTCRTHLESPRYVHIDQEFHSLSNHIQKFVWNQTETNQPNHFKVRFGTAVTHSVSWWFKGTGCSHSFHLPSTLTNLFLSLCLLPIISPTLGSAWHPEPKPYYLSEYSGWDLC